MQNAQGAIDHFKTHQKYPAKKPIWLRNALIFPIFLKKIKRNLGKNYRKVLIIRPRRLSLLSVYSNYSYQSWYFEIKGVFAGVIDAFF